MDYKKILQPLEEVIAAASKKVATSKTEFDETRSAKLDEADQMLEKVRMNRRLFVRKVTSLKKELEEVIKRQSALAEEIVNNEDAEGADSLDKELVELNQKKMVLESKINAFDTDRAGFMEPSKRADFLATWEAYEAIEYRSNNLDDLIQLRTHLNELLEKVNKVIHLEKYQSSNAQKKKPNEAFNHFKGKVLELFATDDSLNLIKNYVREENKKKSYMKRIGDDEKIEIILKAWLNGKENISFERYIPMYIRNERIELAKRQREEDERELRERREREKRNAEAAAAVNRRLGGGHYF